MYLPFTPVMADMWRASTGLAARAAAPDIVESILATGLVGNLCVCCVGDHRRGLDRRNEMGTCDFVKRICFFSTRPTKVRGGKISWSHCCCLFVYNS